MSVAGIETPSRAKVPEWESELWSYVRDSDGDRCPLYGNCELRLQGNLCPCDYVGQVEELLALRQFDPSDYYFIDKISFDKFYILIEKLANKFLEKGNVKQPPVPMDIIYLADEKLPIEICSVPLNKCNGATWRLNDCWVIYINSNDPITTRRFTLFHEVFHIITRSDHCYSYKVKVNGGHAFYELLAERFAASLLMPRSWVREKWSDYNDLDRMADIFLVPKPVMYIELKLLQLI